MRYIVEITILTMCNGETTRDVFRHRFGVETVARGLFDRCYTAYLYSSIGVGSMTRVRLLDGDKVLNEVGE